MEVRRPEFNEARAMMSASESGDTCASRVGAELRAARLRLGWTLEEVAQGLRIRLPFLEAIEEGRIGDLPGSAYAVGFVRTYANSLGLDPDEVARRFRAEGHEVNRKTELAFPAPVPDRGVPAGAVVLLGLILAIGAYAVWYRVSPVRHDEPTISAVPERLAPLAENVAPSHVSPQVASILPPPTQTVGSPAPAVTLPSAPSPLVTIPVPVPVPVTLTPTPLVNPSTSAPTADAADASRVMLKFKANSYVQVREKQGSVLLNRVMRAGESWPVPKQPNLVMTTGNAGGTDIVVDGVAAAPLGASGVVRRDISLEPDSIKLPPGVKLPPQPRQQ
ncbi:MAG: helix-turn-helix domain-containing protein [Janthinobacterium lividum]